MYPEGICLCLIEEFSKVLDGTAYSILPLHRLSESCALVGQSLSDNSNAALSSMTSLAENMLKRPADKPTTTQEVVSRVGLGNDTVDDAGNYPLCRPINQSRAALNNATRRGVKVSNY